MTWSPFRHSENLNAPLMTLDVLEVRLAHRLLRLADGLDSGQPVLSDHRLAIGPVRFGVDLERVRQSVLRDAEGRHLWLRLTVLVILLDDAVVDEVDDPARCRVRRKDRLDRGDVRDGRLDDPTTLLRLLRRVCCRGWARVPLPAQRA